MFEPLPTLIRMERERQGLTQQQLAKLARVSRHRVVALEKGDISISLAILLKVANTLGMRELRVGGLQIIAAPVELSALLMAAQAISTAQKVVMQASTSATDLEALSGSVTGMIERLLEPVPDVGIGAAVERLLSSKADHESLGRALDDLAETSDALHRIARPVAAPAAAARKRKRPA